MAFAGGFGNGFGQTKGKKVALSISQRIMISHKIAIGHDGLKKDFWKSDSNSQKVTTSQLNWRTLKISAGIGLVEIDDSKLHFQF